MRIKKPSIKRLMSPQMWSIKVESVSVVWSIYKHIYMLHSGIKCTASIDIFFDNMSFFSYFNTLENPGIWENH